MSKHLPIFVLLFATPVVGLAQPKAKGEGWYNDYATAKAEAKRTNKPLLVLLRCEPCTDFAKFDAQVVRGVKPLDEVYDHFIRVRLTRISGLDLSLFDFDFDLSWAALMLNADEIVYGRYGGRDAQSIDGRLSVAGLAFAMKQALAMHQAGGGEKPDRSKAIKPEDYPAAKLRKRNDCIHCHLVNEFRRYDLTKSNQWKRSDLWVYPLPENIGLVLDVERGDTVKAVMAGSPATKAGLKPGDTLKKLNGRAVNSFADAQYTLHDAPKAGRIPVEWKRGNEPMTATIELSDGWRKTDITWRPSLLNILPTMQFSGMDLSADEKKTLRIPDTQAAFRQDKFVHSSLKAAGLVKDDIITGVNGHVVTGTMEDFFTYMRREYLVGDTVTINILREGKKADVRLTLK